MIQNNSAMIALSQIQKPLIRPVVISVMPGIERSSKIIFLDEEVGGKRGMKVFCKSEIFKNLKVSQVLDEGNKVKG